MKREPAFLLAVGTLVGGLGFAVMSIAVARVTPLPHLPYTAGILVLFLCLAPGLMAWRRRSKNV